jgi:hypothetical protein
MHLDAKNPALSKSSRTKVFGKISRPYHLRLLFPQISPFSPLLFRKFELILFLWSLKAIEAIGPKETAAKGGPYE